MHSKLQVAGIDIEWREDEGLCLWAGAPVMTAWIESTMAGMLATFQKMVGAERFELAMQQGGRDSIGGDWGVIASAPTFEEGFQRLSGVAAAAGWGRWELVSIDLAAREARVRIYNNWESIAQRAIGVSWGASFVAGKLAGIFQRHFRVPTCWAEQTAFVTDGETCDEFIVRPSNRTLEDRLDALFQSDQVTKADLAVALERVRKEVEERSLAERELREKLDLIARQEEAIRALSTPIIEVWDGVLTLPLFGVVDTRRAAEMMERLLDAITHKGARTAIIDLTGVDTIDAETADHIGRLVRAAELVGAKCVITGIRPAVAQTMVEIGIDLTKIATLSTLREALRRFTRPANSQKPKNS
ncbi:STAS domain-containing protein [Polyangium sp. y55x31]|uniref:STAS domain-containing protein n=1 Tax=Polyangium sp. y55x31 TaxID=3042688 RepID=UPI002482EE42|nr:STAS domain-containing protein [Polyangium sp. y55x31]MDI1481851.1 STAS domain-containing protein [Polyangium sp. y55x31]